MDPAPKPSPNLLLDLCSMCGLCCNGVLFADVELQRSDNSKRLASLGFALEQKGRKKRFLQPCGCFDGKLCSVYKERPAQCRAFECSVFKRAAAGVITERAAKALIRQTQRRADQVRTLLRRLGQQDDAMPLTHRFQQVMAQPIDLSESDDAADLRGELMMAVHELMHLAQTEFLSEPKPS